MQTSIERLARNRAIYDSLKAQYVGSGRVKVNALNLSSLKEDVVLDNSNNSYEFQFSKEKGNSLNKTERMLRRNDLFVVTDMKLMLVREELTRVGAGIPRTYPHLRDFGNQARDMEAIYNGYSEVFVDNERVWHNQSNKVFRFVPEDVHNTFVTPAPDPALALTAESASYAQGLEPYDDCDGLYGVEPLIYFEGEQTNTIRVHVSNFNTLDIESDDPLFENRLVCQLYGVLIEGLYKVAA